VNLYKKTENIILFSNLNMVISFIWVITEKQITDLYFFFEHLCNLL